MASPTDPVVCSLPASRADHRLTEWSDLRSIVTSVEVLADGVRLRIPVECGDDARELAERESQCCAFLEIETVDKGESIEMTITSPNPDGIPIVDLLAGLEDR